MIKQNAMRTLQQKKQYEAHRQALMQQSFNLEQANFTVENIRTTRETVQAMQVTAQEMKRAYKSVNPDSVADLQDDLAEMMADASEIQEMMGRSYAVPDGMDELDDASLAAELDEISAMPAEDIFASLPATPLATSSAPPLSDKESQQPASFAPMAYPSLH